MAETLLAILFVTTSAKGSSLVYRWPPSPQSSPRLSRARLTDETCCASQLDNPWRASHFSDATADTIPRIPKPTPDADDDYHWQRPDAHHDRSPSPPGSNPASGRSSPTADPRHGPAAAGGLYEYDHLFGYSAEFLASLLCPQRAMCHQKFELLVDGLAFIGHPVCAEPDGEWRFKPERAKGGSRGREARGGHSPRDEGRAEPSPDGHALAGVEAAGAGARRKASWLHTFHFVMVLDIPDPSSSASGNVSRYFDIIYEQIAFTVTAVLFQEQVLCNFVEEECDRLGSLKDTCISKGEPFSSYVNQALEVSSIAPAMKALYEAIKSSYMAYITIHNLPLEIQLPPYLDVLLHSEVEPEADFVNLPNDDDDETQTWGPEMSFGWRLPVLTPWKSLLLLDAHNGLDPHMNLKGGHVNPEDRTLVEGLIRFLETASVTLSLADMAGLLDWDLESQVIPTVRWLVQHRRAKIVDIVHAGLKTVFTLPPKFDRPLSQLTAEFASEFSHPSIPPLPQILSTISTAIAKQSENHFFASVVQSKELIPMYHDVVLWMLKRDMLITLHLRVRVVATRQLKIRVRFERDQARARRAGGVEWERSALRHELEVDDVDGYGSGGIPWLALSPKAARRHSRRQSNESLRSQMSELVIRESGDECGGEGEGEKRTTDEEMSSGLDDLGSGSGWDTAEDFLGPTMISDPGRATPLQRRWLAAMSEGKALLLAKRFQLINQYFDGKKTDDEILYRAGITRKQLREVLHHYDEYLQTFLHPS